MWLKLLVFLHLFVVISGISCWKGDEGKDFDNETSCGADYCYTKYEPTFGKVEKRGCDQIRESEDDIRRLHKICFKDKCNNENGTVSPPKELKCYEWKKSDVPTNETICTDKEAKKACYVKYSDRTKTEVVELGCGFETSPNITPCFEPLCNTKEPHKCYEGFVGDCEWIGIFKGQKSFPTPNACDRRQSQKDVCIRQRWTHVNETKRKCEFYQCRHTHVEHGIDFLGKNDSYCKNYTINDHHAEVCRCKGNSCFKPEEKEISCYLQLGESENGNLTKCPPYTTHCYYKRHNLTKAITTRKCSDSANIHLKCHTAENSIWEDCDCYGNACNDIHFKRQCITGVRGDCNDYDEFIGIKFHEPISTECHSWVEQSCFTTTIANGNGTCTVYSCERFWPNFINGSETGSDNCRSEGNVKECSCIGKDCQTADTSKKSSSMMKSLEMIVGILLILI